MAYSEDLHHLLARLRGDRVLARDEMDRLAGLGLEPLWGHRLSALFVVPEPPSLLHVLGSVPDPGAVRVAVVGSRRASAAGRRTAYRLGRELSEYGLQVVSGLARGIDSAALEGAVAGGGAPIAVLGNGFPAIYPPENRGLADRIRGAGGCLLSELPLDSPPRRHHFPRRNRLISGLSIGVVVVEASLRSGSLITAGWALDQGREVLAFPGPVGGPEHEGCHRLIQDGAALVTGTEDVILVLGHERADHDRGWLDRVRRAGSSVAPGSGAMS